MATCDGFLQSLDTPSTRSGLAIQPEHAETGEREHGTEAGQREPGPRQGL